MLSRDDFIRLFIALSFPVTLSRTSGHLGFRGNKGEGVRVYSVERGARKQREEIFPPPHAPPASPIPDTILPNVQLLGTIDTKMTRPHL